MALRQGLTRYAVRFQYHGGSFLGFSQQKQEDCILPDGTDLCGYTSVETRLRRALGKLLASSNDEDFQLQVSSRTDRGVHALGNTLHVDVPTGVLTPKQLLHGWQYHLAREEFYHHEASLSSLQQAARRKRVKNASLFPRGDDYRRGGPGQDISILNAVLAPLNNRDGPDNTHEDWNARFSATERLYVYRIIEHSNNNGQLAYFLGAPFEWDRSWLIQSQDKELNRPAMQAAAQVLIGEHDFSSFRAKGCQQSSPVVHLRDVCVQAQPYYGLSLDGAVPTGGLLGMGAKSNARLITISVRASSFLYRMVRNLVGYLVHVGQQDFDAPMQSEQSARELLQRRDRSVAPSMAPAQGLFLVHVQHGDFDF